MELQRVGHNSEREQPKNINIYIRLFMCFPVVKNLPANAGDAGRQGFNPWARKIPWRTAW